MPVIPWALIRTMSPYLVAIILGLFAGSYIGYHIGADGLAAAKLALSVQQADDAKAAAAANAAAAVELGKANADANAAEIAVLASSKQASAEGASIIGQVAQQAAQPGQDAPDAPVLSHTLDALKGLP